MPATICGISLWISGSPPGIETIGRPALIHRAQRLLHAQPLLQDLLGIIDLAAARAGEIALEQRLQHQHQRITLHAAQLLGGDVLSNPVGLNQWDAQIFASCCFGGRSLQAGIDWR